jgi:excisionase family DNA binding protein
MSERLAYPIPEAAEQLGVGRTKLYDEIAAGRIATVTIGRRRLVPHAELAAYLDRLSEEQCTGARAS